MLLADGYQWVVEQGGGRLHIARIAMQCRPGLYSALCYEVCSTRAVSDIDIENLDWCEECMHKYRWRPFACSGM